MYQSTRCWGQATQRDYYSMLVNYQRSAVGIDGAYGYIHQTVLFDYDFPKYPSIK